MTGAGLSAPEWHMWLFCCAMAFGHCTIRTWNSQSEDGVHSLDNERNALPFFAESSQHRDFHPLRRQSRGHYRDLFN